MTVPSRAKAIAFVHTRVPFGVGLPLRFGKGPFPSAVTVMHFEVLRMSLWLFG